MGQAVVMGNLVVVSVLQFVCLLEMDKSVLNMSKLALLHAFKEHILFSGNSYQINVSNSIQGSKISFVIIRILSS